MANREEAKQTDLQDVLADQRQQRNDTGMSQQTYLYLLRDVVDDGHATLGQWCSKKKRSNVERNGVNHGRQEDCDRDAVVSLLFLLSTTTTGLKPPCPYYHVKNVLNKRHLRGLPPPLPMEKAVLGARTRYLPMRRNLAHGASDIKRSVRRHYHYYKKLNKIATNSAFIADVARPNLPLLLVGGYQSKPINCGSNERGYPADETRVGCCDVGDADGCACS